MKEREDNLMDVLREAVQRLEAGEAIGYPTETVWGLAVLPDALPALYELKGRASDKPVQVSCQDTAAAQRLTRGGRAFDTLAAQWPGPLTLVVPPNADCPAELAPGGWVGLRVPDHPIALALLRASGGLLATTSLNPSGRPAARTLEEARAYGLVPFLLPDGGVPAQGLASTVVRVDGETLEVLREGALPVRALWERLRAAGLGGDAG
ncbi:L-threonylcarbamoyladenylate synthase [Deinococcus hopiensis]|uniref:L-threonylcarbamoyladenylate synthase n=1 Tax=Deinococcus hopiensis TaxID=309885 RepID=UPI001FEB6FEC|nr:L-threonylcarbamoyladenylate synthase [Deinococcus hopiensis]